MDQAIDALLDETHDRVIFEPHTGRVSAALLEFDQPDCFGKVIVARDDSGLLIYINGRCLAKVDLFASSTECQEIVQPDQRQECAQIILYTGEQHDDPLGHVRWLPDQAQFLVNRVPIVETVQPWCSIYTVVYAETLQPTLPPPRKPASRLPNAAFAAKHPDITSTII